MKKCLENFLKAFDRVCDRDRVELECGWDTATDSLFAVYKFANMEVKCALMERYEKYLVNASAEKMRRAPFTEEAKMWYRKLQAAGGSCVNAHYTGFAIYDDNVGSWTAMPDWDQKFNSAYIEMGVIEKVSSDFPEWLREPVSVIQY